MSRANTYAGVPDLMNVELLAEWFRLENLKDDPVERQGDEELLLEPGVDPGSRPALDERRGK